MKGKGKRYYLDVVIRGKDALTSVLGKAGRSVKAFGASLARSGKAMWSGVKEAAKFTLGLGALAWGAQRAGSWLYGMAKDAADLGGKLADLRTRTGLGTDMLQELQYVAEQGGMSLEEFGSAMQTATKNVGDLAAGRGKLRGFLSEVAGPKFSKALKAASPEARLELILGGLLQIKDEAKRAAYAQAFFGESGIKLAAMADLGAGKIAELRREAHEFGRVMATEDVVVMDEVGDELGKLEGSIDGVKKKFGVELARAALPVLKTALKWIKENQKAISGFAKSLAGGVVDAAVGIKDAFVWLYDHREEILSFAKLLGVALVAASGPVGWMVAALGSVVGMIAELNKWANQTEGEREVSTADAMTLGGGGALLAEALGGKGTTGWWNRAMDEKKRAGLATVAGEEANAALAIAPGLAGFAKSQDIVRQMAINTMKERFGFGLLNGTGQPQKVQVEVKIDDQSAKVQSAKVVDAPRGSKPVVQLNQGSRRVGLGK